MSDLGLNRTDKVGANQCRVALSQNEDRWRHECAAGRGLSD